MKLVRLSTRHWVGSHRVRQTIGQTPGRLVLLVLVLGLIGCNGTPRPQRRLGALPFFGAFTLYETADPAKLGTHSYRGGELSEQSRGIVYTCKGGFLDVSHLRTAIDWTWYSAVEVRKALAKHEPRVVIDGMDETQYHVQLNYPPYWDQLGPILEAQVTDRLAIGIALKLSHDMLTWHEIATWYGYKSTGFISEFRSAFTWDDMSSHIVGLRVAAKALTQHEGALDDLALFDLAVTKALNKELHRLGALSPKLTRLAVRRVEGRWWANGQTKKRQIEAGLNGKDLRPWLAPMPEVCGSETPKPLEFAGIHPMLEPGDVQFYDIALTSDIWELDDIRADLGSRLSDRQMIEPRTDFPEILKQIRRKTIEADGKLALEP